MLKPGSFIIINGDSVTDAGRVYPCSERANLGRGYSMFFDSMLTANRPQDRIRVRNVGVSGFTTREILDNLDKEVISQHPDVMTLLIGVNDVWRQFDAPLATEKHVYIDEYEKNLCEIVNRLRSAKIECVLAEPFMFEPDKSEPMSKVIREYGAVCRKTAERFGLTFVPLQERMDRFMRDVHPMAITWDRVHPNNTAHYIIANEFLKAFGYPFAAE